MREEYGEDPAYSYTAAPESPVEEKAEYYSETEFGQAMQGKDVSSVLKVVDELITILQAIQPQIYNGFMRKLNKI